MSRIREKLTYANLMASVAVFLALGGVTYAATQLPKASVGQRQLKPGAVSSAKIKAGAVTGAKVKDGSLGAADLAPGTIPTAPAGARGPAGEQGPAGPAGPPGSPGAGLEPARFIDAGLAEGTGSCGTHEGFVDWEAATTQHVGYYRSPAGIVHLAGTALQCTPYSGDVFTLPPGYRPVGDVFFLVDAPPTTGGVRVVITPGGVVSTSLGNVEEAVSLDGVSFRCGPAGARGALDAVRWVRTHRHLRRRLSVEMNAPGYRPRRCHRRTMIRVASRADAAATPKEIRKSGRG